MKFLLTGATGFVGKHMVKRLRELNHDVVILTRNITSAQKTLPYHIQFFAWNPQKEPAPFAAFAGVEAVIHLAGEGVADHRWSNKQKEKILNSRVLGTRHLVQTLNQLPNKPKTFVSTSAIGIYGNRDDEVLNESAPVAKSGFLADVCRDWETEAQKTDSQIALSLIRTGIVLGLEGGALAKMLLPFKMGAGGQLGNGKQWMSWIHVKDLVEMYIHCATNTHIKGIFNGVAPNPLINHEFTKILGDVLKRPTFAAAPAIALKALLGEMSEILLNSQRCYPQNILSTSFHFEFSELKAALEDILKKQNCELLVEQWVPAKLADTFSFFSNARNLEAITPPWLKFNVLTEGVIPMQPGTLIDYKLKVRQIPLHWQSRIEAYELNKSFVDTQVKGPYQSWEHTHEFLEKDGGTLIIDKIKYEVPFRLLTETYIKKDIQKIFSYRRQKIAEIFSKLI